ncbi:MAG: hypothetical protein JNL11_11515 [Bdellovibrionaceae bacterium]|nr:hypothetical protein [Pseudobdellovibrionaceae bacterium]
MIIKRVIASIALVVMIFVVRSVSWFQSRVPDDGATVKQTKVLSAKRKMASENEKSRSKSESNKALNQYLLELKKTKDCYTIQTCPFDQSDPRAYDFTVGKKLAQIIKELRHTFKDDPSSRTALKAVGVEFFRNENGFVQSEALQILRDFPEDDDVIEALVDGLKDSYNPALLEMALPELKKYVGTPHENHVHDTLSELILGAHFSSLLVSENILSFITRHSYERYQSLLHKLDSRTQSYRNLHSALKEYEMREKGG